MTFTNEEQEKLRRVFSVVVSDSPPPPDLDSLPTSDFPYVAAPPHQSRWRSAAAFAVGVVVFVALVSIALLMGTSPGPDVVGTTPPTEVPTTDISNPPDSVATLPADPPDAVKEMISEGEELLSWGTVADAPFALVGTRQGDTSCVQLRPSDDSEWCGPVDGPDLLTIVSVWVGEGSVLVIHASPDVDHVRLDTATGSTTIAIDGEDSGYPPVGLHVPRESELRGTLVPTSSAGVALSGPVPILVRGLDQAPPQAHPSEIMVEAVEATDGATYLGGDNPGINSVELMFSLGTDTYELFAVPTGTNIAYLDLENPTQSVAIDGSMIDLYEQEDTTEALFDRKGLTVRVRSMTSSQEDLLASVERLIASIDNLSR